MSAKQTELSDLLSVAQTTKLTSTSRRMLRRLSAEGRVPFAEQVGTRWTFTQASVEFLNEHYSPEKRQDSKGLKGEQSRINMLAAAAKLDKACRKRQKLNQPQYWDRKKKAG